MLRSARLLSGGAIASMQLLVQPLLRSLAANLHRSLDFVTRKHVGVHVSRDGNGRVLFADSQPHGVQWRPSTIAGRQMSQTPVLKALYWMALPILRTIG